MSKARSKLRSVSLAAMLLVSVVAGAVFVPTAAAHTGYDGEDAHLSDGGTYWSGQDVLLNSTHNDSKVQLYTSNGDFVREFQTDSKGNYLIGTSGLSGGYYVELPDSSTISFETYQQDLNVSAEDSTVRNGDSDRSNTKVAFESNRAGYDVTVAAEGLTADDLAGIFGVTDSTLIDTENDTVTLTNLESRDNRAANFTGVSAADYTFQYTVVDTGESASNTVTVKKAGNSDASFSSNSYTEEEGDVASITVNLENTQTADVQLGSQDMNYVLNFSVTDNDGDGKVTVLFNTYAAGQSSAMPVATPSDSKDTVSVTSETSLNGHLDTGTYDLSVSTEGEERDLSQVLVGERSTDSASTFVVPGSADFSDVESLTGAAVPGDEVANGDYLVVAVEASGLEGYTDGLTAADLAKGSTFSNNNGVFVNVVEQNPDMNSQPYEIPVDKATLHTDADNDRLFLVFDTSNLSNNVETGDTFEASFVVNESNPYVADADSTETVSSQFSTAERKASINGLTEGEVSNVTANVDEVVTFEGETSVAPGTEVSVTVRSSGENPILKSQTVEVAEDGTFAADFDFSKFAEDQKFTVELDDFGTAYEAQYAGAEEPEPETHNVTVNVENENGEVVDANVALNGQSATTQDGSAMFEVQNGEYTVEVAADGYQSASQTVTVDGQDASVTVTLTAEQTETETTEEQTEQQTEEQTEMTEEQTEESTSEDTASEQTESGGQPGFGAVAALVAVLAAALVAFRRD